MMRASLGGVLYLLSKLVLAFAVVCVCSCSNDMEWESLDRSYINAGSLSFDKIDELIINYDKSRADSGSAVDYRHFYVGYAPFSKTLLEKSSKDSSVSPISVSIARDSSEASNLSYLIDVNKKWKFWMDVYGCADINCKSATAIVFHDEKYDYYKKIDKEDFEFSAPSREYFSEEFGTDCTLRVNYFFDLTIKSKDVKLKMSVQHAKESCEVKIYL